MGGAPGRDEGGSGAPRRDPARRDRRRTAATSSRRPATACTRRSASAADAVARRDRRRSAPSVARTWGRPGALLVRMGIHTGAAEERDGDYYGADGQPCGALDGVAHGGQIVVSHATEELARDQLDPGTDARSTSASTACATSPRPERVFQVVHADLRPRVPAAALARRASAATCRRSSARSSGAKTERAAIVDTLDEARLVTLTGVGGVGKTRLALDRSSRRVRPTLPTARGSASSRRRPTLRRSSRSSPRAVRLPPRPGLSLAESIVEYLRGRTAARRARQLRAPARRGRAARRARSSAAARRCGSWRRAGKGSASTASRSGRCGRSRFPTSDAVGRGGVERPHRCGSSSTARRPRAPTFALDASNADGGRRDLPAARRHPARDRARGGAASSPMNPGEIAGVARRAVPAAHRRPPQRASNATRRLRATVDWSYSLLPDAERTVFDRLGVFAGSFDAAAATDAVTGDGVEAWDVLDALGSLVAKSMVTADDASGGAPATSCSRRCGSTHSSGSTSAARRTRGDAGTRRTTQCAPRRPGWA